MAWLIFLFGIYLIIDGVASLIYFHKQRSAFQLIRVGRTLIGCIIIIYILARM